MVTYQASTDQFDPLYYERMANSLGDKKRLLPFVLPGTVLDIGSGGGELGFAIQSLVPDVHVLGIDPYPHPDSKIPVFESYADEVDHCLSAIPANMPLQTIVACSILHEVFSYGNRDSVIGRYESIERTLLAFYNALPAGGRVLIRDGIKPHNAAQQGLMVFSNTDDDEWVSRFIESSPFSQDGYDRKVAFNQVGPGFWEGDIGSLVEFAFTVTWGPTSFPRESQEFYTAIGYDDITRMANNVGFSVEHHESYTQPGYQTHLIDRITFNFDFPASNAIYVLQK